MWLAVGWVLAIKGAVFLFGARNVVGMLQETHPVTFDYATRRGVRRYVAGLRIAGFLIALVGVLLIWLNH